MLAALQMGRLLRAYKMWKAAGRSALLISSPALLKRRRRLLTRCAPGAERAASEARDLLGVERLAVRLPETAQIKAELSWEWRRRGGSENASVLTLVEAVHV